MKTTIIIIFLVISIAVCFFIYGKTRNQVRRMTTLDSMGQILVALDRTAGESPLEQYDPVVETQKIFPSISVRNGQIMDGWGNPIKISIKRVKTGLQAYFTSAGPDGVMGSKDDVIREEVLFDKGQTGVTK